MTRRAFIAAKGAPFDGPPALLRGKKIGVQKDSSHADWVDKSFRRSAQIKRYGTLQEALAALVAEEVDAVFGDKVQLWLWSQKQEGKCCEIVGQDIKDAQTLGIGVSAGLRREDIKLRDAFNKALATPDVVKRMGELAITPVQSSPDEATKYFNSQLAFWDPIVKASGAKPE